MALMARKHKHTRYNHSSTSTVLQLLKLFDIPPAENLDTHVTKDELRVELERQAQRYKDVYGGEVITYAAQPDPERRPWRKKPSLLDQAFQQELHKIEQARESD